jgi:hypothetical protein
VRDTVVVATNRRTRADLSFEAFLEQEGYGDK